MLRRRVAVIAFLALLIPSSLSAQSRLQITVGAFGGAALPASDLVDVFIEGEGLFNYHHKSGFAGGGRLAVWPTARFGIELEATYAGADVDIAGIFQGFAQRETVDANIFFSSVNLMWAVIAPPLDPVAFYVSAGAGVVSRGGDFFANNPDLFLDNNKTDFALIPGVGLRYGLGPGWRIRFDVRDYISWYLNKELEQTIQAESQIQNDIMLTVGIEFFFSPGR